MTDRSLALIFALICGCSASGSPSAAPQAATTAKSAATSAKASARLLTKDERLSFIRAAQIWMPTTIPAMDLRAGPPGRGSVPPHAEVNCTYVEEKLSGSSRKFSCTLDDGDVVKVRYGLRNGQVEGSVIASRLLWALGFMADRVYPARVVCNGCSPDPWTKKARAPGSQAFDPAVIERKPAGHEMKAEHRVGWSWPELALIDEAAGGASQAQRDGLRLLAVFMQHNDTQSDQQRLLCLPGGLRPDGLCDKPFLALHDVGLTFGRANFWNLGGTGSVNLYEWEHTPIWRDSKACIGHLSRAFSGTIADPPISEPGRAFLAGLLMQLTDGQLHDLFNVARVEARSRNPNISDKVHGAPGESRWNRR